MSINTYHLLKDAGVSERRVLQLLTVVSGANYTSGEVIWPRGSSHQPWMHIFTGLVCGGIPQPDGGFEPLHIFGPNTWFGEASIISEQPSDLEYVCLADVRAMLVPAEATLEAFQREQEFSKYITQLITRRGQQSSELLKLMRMGSPVQRVVMGLALIAEALRTPPAQRPSAVVPTAVDTVDIPVKQAVLASMCGVSRGIFSTCIQQLARAGWCDIQYATIRLLQSRVWVYFSTAQRHKRIHTPFSGMPEVLEQLDAAAAAVRENTPHTAVRHA